MIYTDRRIAFSLNVGNSDAHCLLGKPSALYAKWNKQDIKGQTVIVFIRRAWSHQSHREGKQNGCHCSLEEGTMESWC